MPGSRKEAPARRLAAASSRASGGLARREDNALDIYLWVGLVGIVVHFAIVGIT